MRIDWTETARGFADYVQSLCPVAGRGAVPVQFEEDGASLGDELLVVGVFDSEHSSLSVVKRELHLVHAALEETSLQVLGFAASTSGDAWALLVAEENRTLHTEAGRSYRREILRMFLEELVVKAWQCAQRQQGMSTGDVSELCHFSPSERDLS